MVILLLHDEVTARAFSLPTTRAATSNAVRCKAIGAIVLGSFQFSPNVTKPVVRRGVRMDGLEVDSDVVDVVSVRIMLP